MALLTAAEARTYNLLGLTGSSLDTEIEEVIDRAGAWIARWLGYPAASAGAAPTIESATYTHYSGAWEGGIEVADDGRSIGLPVLPVSSVTSIHDDTDWDYGSGELIPSGDYVLDGVNGYVWLRTDASDSFTPDSPRAVKVVYVAGFSTVPDPIKQAAGMVVRTLWDARKQQGRASLSTPATSASLRPLEFPPLVYDLLRPYQLQRGGIA
jgi:hypothetical protein